MNVSGYEKMSYSNFLHTHRRTHTHSHIGAHRTCTYYMSALLMRARVCVCTFVSGNIVYVVCQSQHLKISFIVCVNECTRVSMYSILRELNFILWLCRVQCVHVYVLAGCCCCCHGCLPLLNKKSIHFMHFSVYACLRAWVRAYVCVQCIVLLPLCVCMRHGWWFMILSMCQREHCLPAVWPLSATVCYWMCVVLSVRRRRRRPVSRSNIYTNIVFIQFVVSSIHYYN